MVSIKRIEKCALAMMMCLILLICTACVESDSPGNTPHDINVTEAPTTDNEWSLVSESGTYSVSTSNKYATTVGMQVLAAGGNAVDAAVAVAYTLSVTQPYASGLGGGGCLLLYDPTTSEYAFYDYFAQMRSTSYTSKNNIGVPGFVKGMSAVHADYGTQDFSKLLSFAISYAENGYTVPSDLATRISVAWHAINDYSIFYDGDGTMLEEGDMFYQPEIAQTLRAIAAEGASAFYTGNIAQQIVNCGGTNITMADLAAFAVEKEQPVISNFMGYEVASAPAPFGGVTVIQMLRMAEAIDIVDPDTDAQKYLDQLYEITSKAYSDRYGTIADPDYVSVDEQSLVSAEHISELLHMEVSGILDDPEHESTTHYTIIDEDGMVVSSTNTLSSFWGSRNHAAGVYLNDTMAHFADRGINCSDYGKTPRSYCAPTIIKNNDGYILSIGTPGGNNIPKILVPVLLDNLKFGTDLQDAIFKARILSRSSDTLIVELREFFPSIADYDTTNYYLVKRDDASYFGNIAAVGCKNGKAFSAYDNRRGGTSGTVND